MPDFVNLTYDVTLSHGFQYFVGSPRTDELPFFYTVFADVISLRHGFGDFFFYTRTT